jgi:hypothetical protein
MHNAGEGLEKFVCRNAKGLLRGLGALLTRQAYNRL